MGANPAGPTRRPLGDRLARAGAGLLDEALQPPDLLLGPLPCPVASPTTPFERREPGLGTLDLLGQIERLQLVLRAPLDGA